MDVELQEQIDRLSPASQRLIRELIFKLSKAEELSGTLIPTTPLDHKALVNPWLENLVREGKSPSTVRQYRSNVLRLLSSYPTPNRSDVEGYLAQIAMSGRSIHLHLFALKSYFRYLADRDRVITDPTARLRGPKVSRKEREVPSQGDIARLLRSLNQTRNLAMVLILVDCGLRAAELTSLELSRVRPDALTVIGKGNKERTVPMSPLTRDAIQRQIEELTSRGYTGPWLFPGRFDSATHLHPRSLDALLPKLCSRSGIPRVHPHQLRHFFATEMLRRGASLISVSKMLGHSRVSTTADTYWHVLDQREIEEAHTKFGPLQETEEIIDGGLKPSQSAGER